MIMSTVSERIRQETVLTRQSREYAAQIRPKLNKLITEFADRFGANIYVMPETRECVRVIIGDVAFHVYGKEQTITPAGLWRCVQCEEENENIACKTVDDMIKVVLMMNNENCKHLKELME